MMGVLLYLLFHAYNFDQNNCSDIIYKLGTFQGNENFRFRFYSYVLFFIYVGSENDLSIFVDSKFFLCKNAVLGEKHYKSRYKLF